jgi:multisubunit Na+/H+ antiporter MnhE subunit
MCEPGCTMWAMSDSLVPGTVSLDPKARISGNHLVGVSSVGAPLRVFRSTLQGYKPIDCRPLTVV